MYSTTLLAVICISFVNAADWGYQNNPDPNKRPDKWDMVNPTCGIDNRQSPIDIDTSMAVTDDNLDAWTLESPGWTTDITSGLTYGNNGHSIQYTIPADHETYTSGGGLPGRFQLLQFHLHWGQNADSGSEHTKDGKAYAAEIHFVHKNTQYDASVMKNYGDGLAVLGVFLKEDPSAPDNENYAKLFAGLGDLQYSDSQDQTVSEPLKLTDLLPEETDKFYRYLGSLTTPGCDEAVIWTVFKNSIKLSSAQLAMFRDKFYSGTQSSPGVLIQDNWRPVQPLVARTITQSPALGASGGSYHWGYYNAVEADERPDKWYEHFETCGNNHRQSPIDIDTSISVTDNSLEDWTLEGWTSTISSGLTYVNNGHSIQYSIPGEVYTSGGGLPGKFQLLQFHFHWGSTANDGSEHFKDMKAYAAEIHFVHKNNEYDASIMKSKGDGLAVLGVFLEEDPNGEDNEDYEKLFAGVDNLPYSDSPMQTVSSSLKLTDLLPEDTDQYYRYLGSLTTPGCDEAVIWTVFDKTVKLSTAQLNKFRNKFYNGPEGVATLKIVDNYRPVQPRASRTITRSKALGPPSASGSAQISISGLLFAALFAAMRLL